MSTHLYVDLLRTWAERTPDAVALLSPGASPLTYGRLFRQIEDVVRSLNSAGLGRGDRIAIVLPNGPEMAVAFLAVSACASSAPLNPAYRRAEFDFYLSDLSAKAVILPPGMDSPATSAAREHGIAVIELSPVLGAETGIFTLDHKSAAQPVRAGFSESSDTALLLHTSGTTARPKLVPLTHANIAVSALNIASALNLSAADRCLNVAPLFHVHGLLAALLASLVSGGSVISSPGLVPEQFFGWMRQFAPTWYTAVPTMHHAILKLAANEPDLHQWNPLRFIRSASSALPPSLMSELEKVFQVPVIEAYGMTETGTQISCNPQPPGVRKPGSVGLAAGPEARIMDESGCFLEPGAMGEIVVRGANVIDGYDNNPAANESAFTNSWFRTGDLGFIDRDGYVFIAGRVKEVINRGGEKISPREIEEALLEHPAVTQAVAFAAPHPTLGEDVAAAVVLRDGVSATVRELQDFAAARVAPFKVPRRVVMLDEIPTGPTGKPQRVGMAAKLGIQTAAAEQVPPRDPMEQELAGLFAGVLTVPRVGIYDDFFEMGGDSIMATQLLSRIRDAMGIEMDIAAFFNGPTVAEMAKIAGHSIQT